MITSLKTYTDKTRERFVQDNFSKNYTDRTRERYFLYKITSLKTYTDKTIERFVHDKLSKNLHRQDKRKVFFVHDNFSKNVLSLQGCKSVYMFESFCWFNVTFFKTKNLLIVCKLDPVHLKYNTDFQAGQLYIDGKLRQLINHVLLMSLMYTYVKL